MPIRQLAFSHILELILVNLEWVLSILCLGLCVLFVQNEER